MVLANPRHTKKNNHLTDDDALKHGMAPST